MGAPQAGDVQGRQAKPFITAWQAVGIAVLCGVLWSILTVSANNVRSGPRVSCANNVRRIAVALELYRTANGRYPPAYVTDASGKPLYSWRVMIAGYLQHGEIAEKFRQDEAWNSPHNRQFIDQMPDVFRCPDGPAGRANCTDYVAITGPGTVFDGVKQCRLEDIKDGRQQTLLVAEIGDSDIVWTEPRDLPLGTLHMTSDSNPGGLGSRHRNKPSIENLWRPARLPEGAIVGFCDGHVQFLPQSVSVDVLRGLSTIAGGEQIDAVQY